MHNIQSPSTDDDSMERRLQSLGKTAPRVTPLDIENAIVAAYYFTALQGAENARDLPEHAPVYAKELGLLTFCVLVLKNGFTVTGESACVSPETFDAEFGRALAYTAAKNKVWPLMGYALKEQLARASAEATHTLVTTSCELGTENA